MIKAVIFDFDGTLVNTADDIIKCFNKTLQYFGYEKKESSYIRSLIGKNIEDICKALLPKDRRTDADIEVFRDKYREIYSGDPKAGSLPYNGIKELLLYLKTSGIKIIISSNKVQYLLEDMTAKLFDSCTFDLIIGSVKGKPPKPSPFFMQTIRENFDFADSEMIYVGDSIVDAETAFNAGIPALIVTWGIGDADLISKEYPVHIVNDTNDIISYIR